MDPVTLLLIIAIVGGFYMAWNIGANDVANAFGTSVGSGAVTIRLAILLAAVCEFTGAFLVGEPVAKTISSEIVTPAVFETRAMDFGIGMVGALLAASVWLNIATFLGQPVSTTHAIIGAVIGFAVVACGPTCIRWGEMVRIGASWVISPIVGGLMAYIIYRFGVRRYVLESRHPVFMAIASVPLGLGALVGIVVFSITYKGLPGLRLNFPLHWAAPLSILVGLAVGVALWIGLRKKMWRHGIPHDQRYEFVERWFGHMQVATACYMSFAHGANDCANAIGPLSVAITTLRTQAVPHEVGIPPLLLAFGGVGIVVGLATYGYKVIRTIGRQITEVTPTRGFSAEFGTATSVLVFSKLGMPISTTFVIVGAVIGVGLARGFAALDLGVVRKIFTSWVVTIPFAAVLSAVFFLALRSLTL